CLLSVSGIVDEIIVVDTGSTDRTIDIARHFGAKVISFPWVNDFSAARNESLRHATSDWILYLDADERIARGQEQLITSLVRVCDAYAYSVLIEGDHVLPGGTVWLQNAYPRLFKKHPSIKFEGVVHEQITPSITRLGKKIVPSNLRIEHLGYGQNLELIKEKCYRNVALLREQLKRNPNDSYARFQLGNTFSVLGEYGSVRKELEPLLHGFQLAKSLRTSALNILAELDIRENLFEQAVEKSLQSLTLAPSQVLARWFLAVAYISRKNYEEAVTLLKKILTIQKDPHSRDANAIAHDVTIAESKILLQLGNCHEQLAHYDEAFACYAQVLGQDSQNFACRNGFNRVVNSVKDYKPAIQHAEASDIYCYPLYKKGIEQAIQAGQFSEALSYIEKIVNSNSVEVPERVKRRLKELRGMLSPQL
ncbi:MAG: glycosyltransferase, partial [Ignavibacteriales bacterium]|nr:glycosyltransferase [Ignavibacteriales bacterium]